MRIAIGRRRKDAESGALSLGYIIVFPAFLLAIMLIMQATYWYLARQAALAAARQGVDAARTLGARAGAGPVAALTFARSAGSGYLISPTANAAGSTAQTVQIQVQGQVISIFPGFRLAVTQVAQAPVEQFTTP